MTLAMDSDTDYDTALSAWFSKAPAPAEDEGDDLGTLGGAKTSPAHVEALERVREWVRERFKLAPEAAILVAEVACNLPGCPPLETAVAFWENEQRHHFKLFKPVEEVTIDNLPFAWMKESMVVPEGFGCECC
jgi:nitrate reductase delta subunit